MRYEFEVGDYVKLIANRTASSKEVGFIGQVKKTKNFPGFGICCALDDNENSWSCLSDLAPSTKAEYEAYRRFTLPKYVKCLVGRGDFTVGKIYTFPYPVFDNGSVSMIDILNGVIWKFEPSTKEAFEAQNKPKPKFKVGDKVRLLVDKCSKSFYPQAEYYVKDLIRSGNSVLIVDKVTNNGRPEWNNQFIGLKGYSYVHPVDCFELAKEDEFKVGGWIKIINFGGGTHPDDVGMITKIVSTTAIGIYPRYTIEIADMKKGNCDKFLDPTVIRLATEAEVKQHLLAEAERRGFKAGVTYLNHNGDMYTADVNPRIYRNHISEHNLECGYGQGLVYDDEHSKWATIVLKDKELCGHKVTKSKDGTNRINIGCKTIFMNEMDGFLAVCEKFDITKVMSGYVKDKSITLDAIKEALK